MCCCHTMVQTACKHYARTWPQPLVHCSYTVHTPTESDHPSTPLPHLHLLDRAITCSANWLSPTLVRSCAHQKACAQHRLNMGPNSAKSHSTDSYAPVALERAAVRDHNGQHGAVAAVCVAVLNRLDQLRTLHHLTKHHVLAVQPACAVCVGRTCNL